MELHDSISSIKGIGPKKAEALSKLNIKTLEDLIYFFPRDYEDRRCVKNISQLEEDETAVIRAKVTLVVNDRYRKSRKQLLRLLVTDDTGSLEVVFFNAGYLTKSFKAGDEYVFYGKVSANFGKMQMVHPDFSRDDSVSGILPVYPLTKGITQREMRIWQKSAEELYCRAEEILSPGTIENNRLCSI